MKIAISCVLHIFYCLILVQKQNFGKRIILSHQVVAKGKAIPLQAWTDLVGLQEVEAS
jgi:hypothetical protein